MYHEKLLYYYTNYCNIITAIIVPANQANKQQPNLKTTVEKLYVCILYVDSLCRKN